MKGQNGVSMKYKIYGKRLVNFTDAKSGSQITGTTLYLGTRNDYVEGVETKKVFVKNSIDCSSLKVNDTININYNEYGKVDSIEVLDIK